MTNYYNENDPKAAAWIRELIQNNLIPNGDVDDRSIEDVVPAELKGYSQCHFFAGIGGWSYALKLAGWPDDKPIWTGSCPCQPFSAAGQREGFADERHLWPAWFWLIEQCKPSLIVGEQVASQSAHHWLDLVFTDLEAKDYTTGAVVLGACSAGAPHKRQRLYWLADANGDRFKQRLGKKLLSKKKKTVRVPNSVAPDHGGLWGMDSTERAKTPDRKTRPIEPGLEPLANGLSERMVRLRGYGNAIVPQVGAEFIKAFMNYDTPANSEESE